MRRVLGQGAIHLGRFSRRLIATLLTFTVLVAVLLMILAWRLSQGPMELAWLIERFEQMVNEPGSPTRVKVGSVALAWDGFQHGLSSPIDLRLTDIEVSDQGSGQRMTIPRVDMLLSVWHLLRLRIAPTALEIDGPRFTLIRSADGSISVDIGTLTETADRAPTQPDTTQPGGSGLDLMRELAAPMGAGGANDLYAHLRIVHIREAVITILDHSQGATWQIPTAEIDLRRAPMGGVEGSARMMVALGQERPNLAATFILHPGDGGARLSLSLSPTTPAALARTAPAMAVLARVDAPLTLAADIDVDHRLRPRSGTLRASLGPGQVRISGSPVALRGAQATVSVAKDHLTLESLTMTLRTRDTATSELRASAKLQRRGEDITGSVTVGFDQVGFADLGLLWPADASPNARTWILENITAGTARNAAVSLEFAARADLSDPRVTRASGGMDGDDLTVHWLRPIAPFERGRARLNFLDHDSLEIVLGTAYQKTGPRNGVLTASGGRMVISGLSGPHQVATIETDIAGSVPATLDLLREPRLGLLSKQKIEFKDPSGEAAIRMRLAFPLEDKLRVEDLEIKVTAKLSKLRLAAMVAGRDIEQGEIDLDVTNTGMTIKGRAVLAAIAVQLDGNVDFKDGTPTQVQRRFSVTGRASARQLAAAGLNGEDWLNGEVSGTAVWSERRNGSAEIAVDADLGRAELLVPPLLWQKPAGQPARGSARVQLARDQMRVIDRVVLDGEGLSFRGAMDCADGRVAAIRMERAQFGRNDLRGTIRLPARQPIAVELTGTIDMDAKLRERDPKPDPGPGAPAGAAWTIDSQFDRAFLANGKLARQIMVRGQFDGRIFPTLLAAGLIEQDRPFRLDIAGPRGQRHLTVNAEDAGALLLGLDLIKTIEGGTLAVTGTFDDSRLDHRLGGTATITDFRVRGSVGLAKLLQAMTLYGLVDILRGPGIGFSELTAPFQKDARQLTLDNARAFSPSLGLTAKGSLFPHEDRVDIDGTIVPAYFFNSLLGRVPLVGRLFSPETGGGVFAARYTVRGAISDPSISVNPLSALTPGFLREIFNIF